MRGPNKQPTKQMLRDRIADLECELGVLYEVYRKETGKQIRVTAMPVDEMIRQNRASTYEKTSDGGGLVNIGVETTIGS